MAVEPGPDGGRARGGDPLIVAWDTCTLRGVLSIGSGGSLLAEEYFEAVKGHTGWLMPQLDSAMKDLDLSPASIDYVAAGTGPGTFTGVKVSVACAKAVAMALEVSLVGMSTLDVLAAGATSAADTVLATVDARRGQLYAAAYRQNGERLERVTAYMCTTPAEVVRVVTSLGFRELAVVGESPVDMARGLSGAGRAATAGERFPAGRALVSLARELVARGEWSDPLSVSPIYLKKPT